MTNNDIETPIAENPEAPKKRRGRGSRSYHKVNTTVAEPENVVFEGKITKSVPNGTQSAEKSVPNGTQNPKKSAKKSTQADSIEIKPEQQPQQPQIQLGESEPAPEQLNGGPFAPQIQKRKEPKGTEEVSDETGDAVPRKRRAPKKITMSLPARDPSEPIIRSMALGQQLEVDPNGTTYPHTENTAVGAGELSLHNTKKDAEQQNLASVMNMVNEMEAKVKDLTQKLEDLAGELESREAKISELTAAIDTVYKPACQIVLKKRRYRRKLNKELLDKILKEEL